MTAILLDIEGTTTSISFVYDVLFPFARDHVREFLTTHATRADVQSALQAMVVDAAGDGLTLDATDTVAVVTEVERLMDADRKATGLKQLQGLIWAAGYASGELRGHVFPDVPDALERWAAAGTTVAIYSSGSVAAQKLIFGCSIEGDLTPALRAYFDTTTGPKKESSSYVAIAEALDCPIGELRFVTDNLAEADAAHDAGAQVWLAVRPGNPVPPDHVYPTLRSFDGWPSA